jgi:hypothetical protein
MKPLILILVVAMALPAVASAGSADPGTRSYTPGSARIAPGAHWYTPGSSLSHPGAHSYTPGGSLGDAPHVARVEPVQARGTDVAAPDQQAPPASSTIPVAVSNAAGFDWGAAGIGAAAGIAFLTAMLGTVVLRRRHTRRPTVATS